MKRLAKCGSCSTRLELSPGRGGSLAAWGPPRLSGLLSGSFSLLPRILKLVWRRDSADRADHSCPRHWAAVLGSRPLL